MDDILQPFVSDVSIAADYLFYITSEAFPGMTETKLSLLLYLAQGYCLRDLNRPLFPNRIEAWEQGPVIPDLRNAHHARKRDVSNASHSDFFACMEPAADDILFGVARTYGRYPEACLQRIACSAGSPWALAYHNGPLPPQEISVRALRDGFLAAAPLTPAGREFNEEDFVGYRDASGFLVLPKEWEDEEA